MQVAVSYPGVGIGYRWVRDEDGNLVRARVSTGVIEEVIVPDPR